MVDKVYFGSYKPEFEIVKQSPVRWQVRFKVGVQSFTVGPLVESEFDAQWMIRMFQNALANISEIPPEWGLDEAAKKGKT